MLRWVLGAAATFGLAITFVACGDSGTEPECEPGLEVFCKCRGGVPGTKTCLDDGFSYGECATTEGPCPEIPDTTSSGPTMICTPDEEQTCSCDTGEEGTKLCSSDGLSFGDCTTASGPCGSTMTGTKLLYETCAAGGECLTGVCEGGYCTRSCEDFTVCIDADNDIFNGDCIVLEGGAKQLCAPYCIEQGECAVFGVDSVCGGALTLDEPEPGIHYSFAACANWGEDVIGLPYGTLCDENGDVSYLDSIVNMPCDIGLEGAQTICAFSECSQGCEEDADCPSFDCAVNESLGFGCCLIDDPQCEP